MHINLANTLKHYLSLSCYFEYSTARQLTLNHQAAELIDVR